MRRGRIGAGRCHTPRPAPVASDVRGFLPAALGGPRDPRPRGGFSVFCPAASSWVYIAGLALGAITRALRAG